MKLLCAALLMLPCAAILAQVPASKTPDKPASGASAGSASTLKKADAPFETRTKAMPDGVTMTADWYAARADAQPQDAPPIVVVCFHMARSSRGEYRDTALEFLKLGCSVLAVDQRSGEKFTDVVNETSKSATKGIGIEQGFAEAYVDIGFATGWARELVPHAKVVLVGSSYSAALILCYGGREPKQCDALLAFSPGEYIDDFKIADEASRVAVPTYITCGSGERETSRAKPIAAAIKPELLTTFWPKDEMKIAHGSRGLWPNEPADRELEWTKVREMLAKVTPPPTK